MRKDEKHILDDMEIKFQSSLCWVTKMDKMRNEDLSRRIGVRDWVSDIK